jgi:3-deoxy-D-manno-octulosonate 8-phosphate phosphatase KdsC-like HAD superfamily phosphatase
LSKDLGISLKEIACIGDSSRDALAISEVGLGLAPADTDECARNAAHNILRNRGGEGAVSETIHFLLGNIA